MDRFNVFSDTNCLYFDEDNPPFLTKHRNKILRKGLNLGPTKKLGYVLSSGIRIDSSEGLNKLVELIELFKPKLVILDSLVRFISKGKTDENRSGDMSDIFTNLRRVANEYDTSFLIIHHSNKSLIQNDEADVIRGSSDIINAVDCAYLFKASGDNIKIQQIKNRYEPKIKPFTVSDVQTVDKDGKTVSLKFEITSTEVDKMDVESRTAVAIYAHFSRDEFLKNGEKVFQTKDAITKFSQELHTSENKARQIIATSLRKLIRDGKIRRIKQGYYKILDMNEERISTLSDFDETEPEEENETEDLT
jgi:RecA-family ATPase